MRNYKYMKKFNNHPIIIFDFDGVIVDSERLSFDAINYALHSFKTNLKEDEVKSKYRGWQFSKIADDLNLSDKNSKKFQQMILSYLNSNIDNIKVIDGIPNLLDMLSRNEVEFCITSNASIERISKILYEKRLNHFFKNKMIFGKEMAKNGKPYPDIYNLSINHFSKDHNKFIAIEDSITGVMAASQAKVNSIVGFIDNNSSTCPSLMKETGCTDIIHNINDFYPLFFS